jgi:hypothetical protein
LTAEVATETPKTKAKKAGRNAKSVLPQKKDAIPKSMTFFDRMAGIEKADWGTRAKVKVYRIEPITDQIRVTGQKYIAIYEEAITEERLKQDCGSGRYRLYLTFKAPTELDKEIDMIELDVLDPHYPPKIPAGAWLDDPRNKKWEWARAMIETKEQQQAAGPSLNGLADTLRAVKEILPAPQKASEVLDTIRAVKEMSPTPPPATQDATLTAIVELVKAQNLQAQTALNAAQERADKLLFQLLDNKKGTGLETFKGVLTEIKDVFGVGSLKDLFSMGKEAVSEVTKGRSRMSGWMEFVQPALPAIVDFIKPFGMAIAQNMVIKAQQNGAQLPPAAAQPQAQPQQPNPGLMAFIGRVGEPLLNYIRMEADPAELGNDFASWLYDGFGPVLQTNARQIGSQNLVMIFRGTPLWVDKGADGKQTSLAEMQPTRIEQFVNSFLAWNPPADDEDEETEQQHGVNGAPVDLSSEVFGS